MKRYPPHIKLSPRLATIFQQLQAMHRQLPYQQIWDCCCDHGYLGMKALQKLDAEQVVFVDCLAPIVAALDKPLEGFAGKPFRTLVADVATLQLAPGKRHCLLIAGVGGKLMIELLQGLQQQNPQASVDYILCATNSIYDLREYLHQQSLKLLSESIVFDSGRHYEVIAVSQDGGADSVSLFGGMWNAEDALHRDYHQRLLSHYEKRLLGKPGARDKAIVEGYKSLF